MSGTNKRPSLKTLIYYLSPQVKENFGIGVFFLGPIKLRFESNYSPQQLTDKLSRSKEFCGNKQRFSSRLTVFEKIFPFNHFVTIKGRVLKNNVVEITIMPIFVRVMQVSIISMMAIIISAIRLYDNRSWAVLGIFALHFAVLCAVWFILRILYVADARTKVWRARKRLRLMEEV